MFYIAKIFQAAGIIVLTIAFIRNFPDLMSYRALGIGIGLFTAGWLIQSKLLRR